jgi:hypothetical protein
MISSKLNLKNEPPNTVPNDNENQKKLQRPRAKVGTPSPLKKWPSKMFDPKPQIIQPAFYVLALISLVIPTRIAVIA